MESIFFFLGGQLKALDKQGKVGGYAVRFSEDGKTRDLSGEWFASDTYLGPQNGDGADVLFHHGIPIPIKARVSKSDEQFIRGLSDHIFSSPVKTKRDAIGLWAETVLDMANEYEKRVYELVEQGKLGWSSGTAGHMAKKSEDGKITRWPIIEISLTPTPCEPMNRALPVKSLESVKFNAVINPIQDDDEPAYGQLPPSSKPSAFTNRIKQIIDDHVQAGFPREEVIKKITTEALVSRETVEQIIEGKLRPSDARLKSFARALNVSFESLKGLVAAEQGLTMKGIFSDAMADDQYSIWKLYDVYSKVVRNLAHVARGARLTGTQFDLTNKLSEADEELMKYLHDSVMEQIAAFIEDPDEETFYLKSLTNPDGNLLGEISIDLNHHSQLVESAAWGVVKRYRAFAGTRIKAGRMLSDKNRQRLQTLLKSLQDVTTDIEKLLEESQPMAAKNDQLAAQSKTLRLQHQARQRQGATNNV